MSDPYKGLKSALGRNVRALRIQRALSQEALAESAGLERRLISEIERASGNPTLETVAKLAMALQVRPGELLDGQFRQG
jgi:transcriptional regulator with XRE-family HTH domain